MFSRKALGSLVSRFAVPLSLFVSLAVLAPNSASALTLDVPADVIDRVDVNASLTSSDPAGLAMLFVDGSLVRSCMETGGPGAVAFAGVPLARGPHDLRVLVRAAEGLLCAPRCAVTAWGKPVLPLLLAPNGGYAGRTTPVMVKAGPGTSSLRLTLNGSLIGTRAVSPGQIVNFGSVAIGGGVNTLVIEAFNPVASSSGTFKVRRLDFPWPTCIIIDKSQFRLYWVRDGVLVKTYPVAIGKPSTPTPVRNWRVGEKYVYTDWGVYGPRRLRLYKQIGLNSFQYSNYGVHGTNQEWVIGTMASHGCIRMFNRDVMELYPQVPLYTMVQTRD
ncbi:MAG TPA: L,D-transpeptidase [Coriobacteriia bacterium]|jgi:hypothetical protein